MPQSYPETRITIWAKSIGTLLVGLSAVVVSCVAVKVQWTIGNAQNANAQRDIKLKQDSLQFQQNNEADRIAAGFVPLINCKDDLRRALAFKLMAPAKVATFAQVISEKCSNLTPQSRHQIIQIENQSAIRQREDDFFRFLANAREWRAEGFDDPAARVFDQATKNVPESCKPGLNTEEVSRAEEAFKRGSFKEASDRFSAAFAALTSIHECMK